MTASERSKATTPAAQFAKAVNNLIDKAKPKPFVIPILTADPPETDPTNLWMRWDGRLRGRRWNGSGYTYTDYPLRTDITSPPAVPAYPAAPAQPAAPQTYTSTFGALWSQGFKGDDTQRTDGIGTTFLPYGSNGDVNGQQKSLIGFDYAAIAAALVGSTVKQVNLQLTNVNSTADSGVQIYFGIHNVTANPSTWPSASLPQRFVTSVQFARAEQKVISLPITFATSIRDGIGKGIAIEAPSSSLQYFGIAAGVGTGLNVPQLIITYAK